MKVWTTMILMMFLGAAMLADEKVARYPWLEDLGKARELAVRTGKPLLIAIRCEP